MIKASGSLEGGKLGRLGKLSREFLIWKMSGSVWGPTNDIEVKQKKFCKTKFCPNYPN